MGPAPGKVSLHRRGASFPPNGTTIWHLEKVGGLSAQDALDLANDFTGDAFLEGCNWAVMHGKNEGDWRGTAFLYRHQCMKTHNSYPQERQPPLRICEAPGAESHDAHSQGGLGL